MGGEGALKETSLRGVIAFGIAMGFLHVVSGPDHVTAISLICASNAASRWRCFWIGLRWGLGHSLGLVIIAAVVLGAAHALDLETEGLVADNIVGAMMVLLGLFGLFNGIRWWRSGAPGKKDTTAAADSAGGTSLHHGHHGHGADGSVTTGEWDRPDAAEAAAAAASSAAAHAETAEAADAASEPLYECSTAGSAAPASVSAETERADGGGAGKNESESESGDAKDRRGAGPQAAQQEECASSVVMIGEDGREADSALEDVTVELSSSHLPSALTSPTTAIGGAAAGGGGCGGQAQAAAKWASTRWATSPKAADSGPRSASGAYLARPWVQRLISLIVGLVHGISGPGGVLGVLPAVALNDPARSTAYLAFFVLASTAAMSAFAAACEELSFRLGSVQRVQRAAVGWALVAAAGSLAVGVAWLVLANNSQGGLEAVGM